MKWRKQAAAVCLILAVILTGFGGYAQEPSYDGTVYVRVEDSIPTPDGADSTCPDPRGVMLLDEVGIYAGESVADVLSRAFSLHNMDVVGLENGYITSIDGLSANDRVNYSGWMVSFNDWFPNTDIRDCMVSDGDEIAVLFSLDMGADIGSDWSSTDTALDGISFSQGRLSQPFDRDTYAYTLYLTNEDDSVIVRPDMKNKNYQARVYLGAADAAQPGYKRTRPIPVKAGDVITVLTGDPSWPTMNAPEYGYAPPEPKTYTFTIAEDTVFSCTVSIEKEDGESVTSMSDLAAGDKVRAAAHITNPEHQDTALSLYFAGYDGGKLVWVTRAQGGGSQTRFLMQTAPVALSDTENMEIRAFLWTNSLTPLGMATVE